MIIQFPSRHRTAAFAAVVAAIVGQTLLLAGSWSSRAPAILGVAQPAEAAINGSIYLAGGLDASQTPVNVLQVYDPIADTWSAKSPMPTARSGTASASVDGRFYVAGGSSTSTIVGTLEVYDPMFDTWATRSSMNVTETGGVAAAVNGKLYVAGGVAANAPNNPRNGLLQVYDPVTNAWTTKMSMPTARAGAGGAEIDGLFYVVGGSPTNNSMTGALEAYDPITDTWSTKTAMPTPRESASAVSANGLLYVIGGNGSGGAYFDLVEVYNPTTDTWTADTPLPTARTETAAAFINGVVYVVGGAVPGYVVQSTNDAMVTEASQTYSAIIQPPINPTGSSVFKASRGVVPVKFGLTLNGAAVCQLPSATIAVFRVNGGTPEAVNQTDYLMPADNGVNFRVSECQYIYNLGTRALGAGSYEVRIRINGTDVGTGMFGLK